MKIAVPITLNKVADHFGHCENYKIFTIENNTIIHEESVSSPEGCGCKSNIAVILKEKGVTLMLAGNMGGGAYNILAHNGIEVIRGCSGESKNVVNAFIHGRLVDTGVGCIGHEKCS